VFHEPFDSSLKRQPPLPDNTKFYDILSKQIEQDLPGFRARMQVTLSNNGSVHDMLKKSSNDLVNELYYEEVRADNGDVFPTLVLKPRPVQTPFLDSHIGVTKDKSIIDALKGKTKTLQKLATENFVEISPAEIKFEDLGRDDHSRFNYFWLTPAQFNESGAYSVMNNLNKSLGVSNPTFLKASIQRHGLQKMERTLEFCQTADLQRSPAVTIFRGFMLQLYDQNFANHLYDSGTIECTGVLEAELGKALIVQPEVEGKDPKVYYIEGYQHEWTYPNAWTTTFTVTHGQFLNSDGQIFIDVLNETDISDNGQEDTDLQNVYLAKTGTTKANSGGDK
jgi:hypothetical protein